MAFTYAGQYTEVVLGTSAAGFAVALPALTVNVYTVGTTTAVTLYTSRTKGSTASNPVTTDVNGNLTFYANPGQYDIVFTPPGGSLKRITVMVPQDPAEDAATYAPITGSTVYGQLLGSTVADVAVASTTTATPLAQFNLPTDAATGTIMRLSAAGDYLNNTGGSQTTNLRIKVGSTAVLDSTLALGANANRRTWLLDAMIYLGASSQAVSADLRFTNTGSGGMIANSFSHEGYGTSAEDLTSTKVLSLEAQQALSSALLEIRVRAVSLLRLPYAP